jgi:hypothetical protein
MGPSDKVSVRSHHIVINGKTFSVDELSLSSAQIRSLGAIPPDHTLVLESQGDVADTIVTEGAMIDVSVGSKSFYSQPPTSFG